MNLLVSLLAPLFVSAVDGDIVLARAAALETITAYRVQNHISLLMVAKIISFGLAALGSLSLSMADDLPIPLVIRLRSNANALNRSAERCERMLNETRAAGLAPEPGEEDDEDEVRAAVAEAQRRAAEARPGSRVAPPPAEPEAAPTPVPTAQSAGEDPYPRMWATAMAEVAAEELAAAAHLPPLQRREATARASILSTTANQLLSGAQAPRPRPGDLDWMTQPIKR